MFSLTINRHKIVAFIVVLLFSCSPSAIIGFIVAIFVRVTINRSTFWSMTHISKKVLQATALFRVPSVTYFNAAPTVIFELFVFWIVAASKHGGPCPISIRPAMAVSLIPSNQLFSMNTAAGLNAAVFNRWTRKNLLSTAIAKTNPLLVTVLGAFNALIDYCETTEFFAYSERDIFLVH